MSRKPRVAKKKPTLTGKQKAFIEHYFVCGMNATEAARLAGYSGDYFTLANVGCENLKKPQIKKAIDARMKELTMSADEALARLTEQARGTMNDFIDPITLTVDMQRAAANGKLSLVKEIKCTVRTIGEIRVETIEFKLYDAQSALKEIIKQNRLDAGKPTEITKDVSDARERLARQLDSLVARSGTQQTNQEFKQ